MKKLVWTLAAVTGIFAIGYGIYKWSTNQIEGAMNFCFKFSKIKILSMKKDRITFDLEVKVKQLSDFMLTISGYDFDVLINGRKIVKLTETRDIKVLPKAVSYFTTKVDFDPSKVFNLADLLSLVYYGTMERDKFIVEINGTLNANIDFVNLKNFPLNIKMTLAEIMAPSNETSNTGETCKIY